MTGGRDVGRRTVLQAFAAYGGALAATSGAMIARAQSASPVPSRVLHVSPSGRDNAPGSEGAPLKTIQAAADQSRPGDLIAVHAGTYEETVKLPSRHGGREDAPIIYASADGRGRAILRCSDPSKPSFYGFGVHDIEVCDFHIYGGRNGVQFSQSGADFSAICRNIAIRRNHIESVREDGVKISQADDVSIRDNTIKACGQQCVDFVNVWRGEVAGNETEGANVAGAIMVKGGSRQISITDNRVREVFGYSVAGIAVGGYSTPGYARPGSPRCEVDGVIVRGNDVRGVEGYALAIMGAWNVEVTDNRLESITGMRTARAIIGVQRNDPRGSWVLSRNISIHGNRLIGRKRELLIETAFQDAARDRIVAYDNTSIDGLQ